MKIVITESQLKNIIIKENENHYIREQDDWDEENYYTKEEDDALMDRIRTTAANYTSPRLYRRDYPGLYREIVIRRLMDELFPKKEPVKKQEVRKSTPYTPYTEEEKSEMLKKAKQLAVNYKNPRQFGLDHLNIYNYLRRAGLMDVVFPNRKINNKYRGWTEDKIRRLAKGYMRVSDFERAHPVAYKKALTLGIANDLFPKNNTNPFSSPDFDLANSNDEKYQKHIDDLTDVAGSYENMSDMEKRNPSLFKQMSKFGHDDRPISDEDDDEDHFMVDFMDDDYDDYTYGGGGSSYGIEPVPDPAGPKTYKPQDLTGVDTFKKPRLRKASEQPGYTPPPPREKPQVAAPVKKSVVNPEEENLRNEYQKLSRELSSAKNRLANAKALYNSSDANPNHRNVIGFYMKQDEDKIEQLTGMINSIKSEMSMKGLKY